MFGTGGSPEVLPIHHADGDGELGRIMSRLASAGVRLEVQYSDQENRKVLVVDDSQAALRALE